MIRSIRRTITAAALFAALIPALAACETSDYGGAGAGEGWGLGPGYVSLDNNKRFGVTYLPDMQAAMLTFTLVGSFGVGDEPPAPPVPDEWRAAAEQAAPEGCALDALEQVDAESWRATYTC